MVINGLDREFVYAHDWAKNVVPDLDVFVSEDQGRGVLFEVI